VIAWAPDDQPTDEQIEGVLDAFDDTWDRAGALFGAGSKLSNRHMVTVTPNIFLSGSIMRLTLPWTFC
jgi:hypothetical protein